MSIRIVSIWIVALVFMFIARLRFPLGVSIVDFFRNRFGIDIVKDIRKLWKVDHIYRKLQLL